MGKVTIQPFTTEDPLYIIGYEAGVCRGASDDYDKCVKRGIECFKSGHGRALEYVQVYATIEGYSIKWGREFYTHIGGSPTRLQDSTRHINFSDPNKFNIVVPFTIENNPEAAKLFKEQAESTRETIAKLIELGIPNEDATALIPLALETKIAFRTNLRMLVDMAHQRKCSKAYWEFRRFFADLEMALEEYNDHWKDFLTNNNVFQRKCEYIGYCNEKNTCGYWKERCKYYVGIE